MKKTLCILLTALLFLCCVPAAATEKIPAERQPMSTFEEVNAMFPEAKLVEMSKNKALEGKSSGEFLSADVYALAVREYVKRVDGDTHILEVFADGSYLTYGMVDDYATVTSTTNYTEYTNMVAYYNDMYPGISMAMSYDYKVNNTTMYNYLTGARNYGDPEDINPIYTGHFNNTVFVSSTHAYRGAEVTHDDSGDVVGEFKLGVRAQQRDLYVYRDSY